MRKRIVRSTLGRGWHAHPGLLVVWMIQMQAKCFMADWVIEGVWVDSVSEGPKEVIRKLAAVRRIVSIWIFALLGPFVEEGLGHESVRVVRLELRDHVRVRIHVGIADEETSKVDARLFVGTQSFLVQDLRGQLGHVVATIRFAGQVKVVALSLREALQEGPNQLVVVPGGLSIVGGPVLVRIRVRKAHPRWNLHVKHVRYRVPTVRVRAQGALGGRIEGPVFGSQAQKAGTPRPTVGPEDDRIVRRIGLAFDVPVKDVPGRRYVEVPGKLLETRRRGRVVPSGQVDDAVELGLVRAKDDGWCWGLRGRRRQQRGRANAADVTARAKNALLAPSHPGTEQSGGQVGARHEQAPAHGGARHAAGWRRPRV